MMIEVCNGTSCMMTEVGGRASSTIVFIIYFFSCFNNNCS